MTKTNIQAMNDAAQQKRTDTLQRVLDALKIMEQESIPINFLSVYKFTGVARTWLYKEPTIREIIKNAKSHTNNRLMQNQALQLKNKDREIDILTKQNQTLRKQIGELKQQLEVAYAIIYKEE